jgi:hypothetical protein
MKRSTAGIIAATVVLSAVIIMPGLALAEINGDCDGWVEIEGVRYDDSNDTPDNPIIIPADSETLVVSYSGGVGFANTNHSGKVALALGPTTITIEDWGSPNPADTRESSGTYDLSDFRDSIPFKPTGIYEVTGEHSADGGSCSGTVFVKFEGNAWSNPIAVGSLALAALSFLGLLAAGFAAAGGAAATGAAKAVAAATPPPPPPPAEPPPAPPAPPEGPPTGGGA